MTPSQRKGGDKPMQTEWQWVCIDGGSDHMVRKMCHGLTHKPLLNKRVNKIALTPNKDAITIGFASTKDVQVYSQVICTAPLGCLGDIDLDGLELLYNQKLAIRSLQYDASTKVGIKFEKRWWEDPAIMGNATIKGGQSSTDLSIRVCVYPSYGFNCPNPPGVLLASYTWAQDARRLGCLAQGKGTPSDDLLLEVTLNNVAKLHGITRDQMGPVLDHYAHSWYSDEHARGAFALFGPAQFGNPNSQAPSLFTAVKAPGANGKFHIAGEATSVHHAWVLGALNSAWRAVYNSLMGRPDKQKLLIDRWGIPDEENARNLQLLSQLARYRRL
jgi:monoamine oxidase